MQPSPPVICTGARGTASIARAKGWCQMGMPLLEMGMMHLSTCWAWRLRRRWPTKFPVDPVDLALEVVASGPKLTNRTLTIDRVRRWTQWRAACIHTR